MQKIEDFKFGMLYKCSNLRALVPWAQRISDGGGREQNYNQFLLHRDKETGELFLIDTYHIKSPGYKNDSQQWFIDELVENTMNAHSTTIHAGLHDCYYNASVPLNEQNAHLFEEILFLPDWRFAKGDASEYNPDDVVHGIWLWWECCYSQGGACLIRKDAKVDTACQVDERVRDVYRAMSAPDPGNFSMRKLREFIDSLPDDADYDRNKVQELELRFEKLSEMAVEWKAFRDELSKRFS